MISQPEHFSFPPCLLNQAALVKVVMLEAPPMSAVLPFFMPYSRTDVLVFT